MPPGKAAAQAAHACAQSLLEYLVDHPDQARAFRAAGTSGTRIILIADREAQLLQARDLAAAQSLPHALFYDSGHILLPHFDGNPILTALAIGPAPKESMRPLTRRFRCA